jgi:hypothetical protein
MCTLQIHMQCYDKFFEVIPDDVETAELMVENVIGHVLLELFGGGTVDDVTIRFSPDQHHDLRHCSVQIDAQCADQGSISLPRIESLPYMKEHTKLAIEKSVCSIMRELFVSVKVDSVMLKPSPWDYGSDPALSHSA